MRSRFSAFALQLPNYIIKTTHKENPDFTDDLKSWEASILDFSNSTQFLGLEILEFIDGDSEAFVTFHAKLSQNAHDCSFTEKSKFYKIDNQWLYHSGVFLEN
jgi:SEC-C motif-containing protein